MESLDPPMFKILVIPVIGLFKNCDAIEFEAHAVVSCNPHQVIAFGGQVEAIRKADPLVDGVVTGGVAVGFAVGFADGVICLASLDEIEEPYHLDAHTGDLAVMYPDGYVKIQDRSKDIIISGGENISSIEIENTLAKHPSVSIAAVVAKPDEKWGEVPCAFIESVKDKTVTEKELIDFCKETLAKFKVPKKIEFCELPKTSTGKIQKFELRKKAKEIN